VDDKDQPETTDAQTAEKLDYRKQKVLKSASAAVYLFKKNEP